MYPENTKCQDFRTLQRSNLKLEENKMLFFLDAPQLPNSIIFVKVHRVRLFVRRVASMEEPY
jgi:hypothetical protein